MVGRLSVTAVVQVPIGEEAPLAGVPNLALRAERAPNLAGARLLGYDSDWEKGLRALAQAGLVVVLNADLAQSEQALIAAAPGSVVVMSTIFPEGLRNAELVLPITNMAEENGTYINRDRRIQRYSQAKSQPGMARPAWWVAGEVLGGPGPSPSAPATAAQAFELLGTRWPAFAGLTHADIGYTGRLLDGRSDRSAESQRVDMGVV